MTTEQATVGRRGRARRAVLITIMALGAVVSLTAVNGVFAVFTDRATTGMNSASSRGEARSADLLIADGTFAPLDGTTACGPYAEDLATGIITATEMVPLGDSVRGYLCLKNVGSRAVDITASVIDLVDTDTACSGDEAALDTTCGNDQVGELSPVLQVFMFSSDCSVGGTSLGSSQIGTMATTPFSLPSLAPGAVQCLAFEVQDQAQSDNVTTSQSDTATWRFAFDGTAV